MKRMLVLSVVVGLIGCHAMPVAAAQEVLKEAAKDFLMGIKKPTRLISEASQACWSPDGTRICYTRHPGGGDSAGGISILALDGSGRTQEITPDGKDATWSPDGKWIAYVREGERGFGESVWLIQADGQGDPVFLEEGGSVCWSPDSKSVIYHSRRYGAVYKMPIAEGEREGENLLSVPYAYPRPSPDGREIAYIGSEGLCISAIDGSDTRSKSVETRGFCGGWSPDGKMIAYGGFFGSGLGLRVIDASLKGEPKVLFPGHWSRPSWSPDGRFILYDTMAEPLSVWIMNVENIRAKVPVPVAATAREAPRPERVAKREIEIPQENLRIPEQMNTCAANLTKIHTALQEYQEDHGKLPLRLSDLVPDHLSGDVLFCPNDPTHSDSFTPDPNLPCSYDYSFSLNPIPSFWDPSGKTSYREWKTQQVRLFGDVVPAVSCHHHDDKHLQLSVGGQVYVSPLIWERMFIPDYQFGDEGKVEGPSAAPAEAKEEAVAPGAVAERKFEIPEGNRQIPEEMRACGAKLRKIGEAIKEYEKDKGELPDWLSDLVPDYLSREALLCPDDTTYTTMTCVDPKLPCSYNYEFAALPFGNREYGDWKRDQMKLFGDLVPIIRCHHHPPRHLNLSIGDEMYWSRLSWEALLKPDYQFGEERKVEEVPPAPAEEVTPTAAEVEQGAAGPVEIPKGKFEIPEENLQIPEGMQSCAASLRKMGEALRQYKNDKGKLPDWLSDLVPDYLSKEALWCPNDTTYTTMTCVDPKLPCSYNYEFSVTEVPSSWLGESGKLFRDWKAEQMRLFGDVVPLVRCHHHGEQHLNLSVRGPVYWSGMLWEMTFKRDYRFGDESTGSQ